MASGGGLQVMTFVRALLAVILVSIAAPVVAAPLAAYGKLPSIESATISPSGHAVAVTITNGEQRTIVVRDLATNTVTLRGLVGTNKVRSVQWAGDKHLVVVASATAKNFNVTGGQREWFYASTIDLETKKLTVLMRNSDKADLSAIFGFPIVRMYKGEPAVFVLGVIFAGGQGNLSLFRIDLATGANRLVEQGSSSTIDWIVDAEGQPLAQEIYRDGEGVWSLKLRTETGWKEVLSVAGKLDRPYLVGLGRDNTSVIYAAPDKDKHWAWREARTDGAPPGPPIPLTNGQGTIRAALDGRLIGLYALAGDQQRYSFFDPADERAWTTIVESFSGQRVTLESWSTDRRKIVVSVDSGKDSPAYALVDLAAHSASWLGAEYVDVKPDDVAPRTPISFKAADGLPLSGYLTLPNGRAARGLPLIVFPHGGPAVRDTPGFDWWAQAMARRGYAVLQVNYRGSDGFGAKHLEAGYGQWGRKMQTDLSDGVRYLAGQGTIDPKRVCVVGASYGGYAALAGVALDPEVYRCAVSVAGLADLRRFVTWARGASGSGAYRYWNRFMGSEDNRDAALAEISPAAHVDRVTAPVLLIHGKDDTVVPLEQSQIMADALRKAGKPVELLIQKGADHWLSRGDTRLETLTATMAFVEKHNPPN